MRIEKINFLKNNTSFNIAESKKSQTAQVLDRSEIQTLSGVEIPFGAIYGVKEGKNPLLMKMQLIKKIEEMLNARKKYSHDYVFMELRNKGFKSFNRSMKRAFGQEYSRNELINDFLSSDNPEASIASFLAKYLQSHEDEIILYIERLETDTEKIIAERAAKDKTNYELLNRLHSTIIEDDANLLNTYKKYYSKLKSFTTLKQVETTYPKIELPPRPEDVSSKKIINTLPKSFFVEYDRIKSEVSPQEAKMFMQKQLRDILQVVAKESGVDTDFLTSRLRKSLTKTFFSTYDEVKHTHGFASYPENRKIKHPILSKTDVELLDINYDNFVIKTLQQQYLEGKKLSEIEYSEGKHLIKVGSLGSTDYKFSKEDEQIKKLLRMADNIKAEETRYESFGKEQFLARIKYFFNHEMFDNEKIMDRLLDFNSSKFVEGDRQPLIRFLRVLDDLCDMKISVKEAEEIIERENLRPYGTDLINVAEREAYKKSIQAEQEMFAEFNTYCSKFDNAIERLFSAGLEETAALCIPYKPNGVEASRELSDKVIKIISEFSDKNGSVFNPAKLEQVLKQWNTYINYKLYDFQHPAFQKAVKFATAPDGNLDEIKAGQYLFNSKIVEAYPESVVGVYSKEEMNVISAIMAKSKSSDDKIYKLMVYENYKMLPERERSKITNILNFFDTESSVDKAIVEAIVKDIYIKVPTYISTSLNKEQTLFKDSVIAPSAKAAILADKQFPACLKYFATFERYMTRAPQAKDENGIQIIGTNNKSLRKLFKQEVKVPMEERLFSTNGDYVFDVYRSGLHKSKITKD